MMGLGMGVGLVLFLAFFGLLIGGAGWLGKSVLAGRDRPDGERLGAALNPRQILDQRYARGEVTREEYERIRTDLAG